MQDAFGIVLFTVVAVAAVAALVSLFGRARLYEQIGRGGLSLNEDETQAPRAGSAGGGASAVEREQEIRQMLDARNDRRRRRGEAPVDVDAEVAALTARPAPAADPELIAEVRSLVVARNERRARAGKPALDVEAEVARQLDELGV